MVDYFGEEIHFVKIFFLKLLFTLANENTLSITAGEDSLSLIGRYCIFFPIYLNPSWPSEINSIILIWLSIKPKVQRIVDYKISRC